MKKKHIRTGIVGSGFSAAFHFESLKKVYGTDVEVVGVFSATPQHREEFARQREIEAFSSVEHLLDACDVIHVCTPPYTHVDLAIEALKRDKFAINFTKIIIFCFRLHLVLISNLFKSIQIWNHYLTITFHGYDTPGF